MHRAILSGSEGQNIFATWGFNNGDRNGISVVPMGFSRDQKEVRLKNPEDCIELSHHHHHVETEVKPSVY